VREWSLKALKKMYVKEEGLKLRDEWIKFVNLRGPSFSQPECLDDRATIAHLDPIGSW